MILVVRKSMYITKELAVRMEGCIKQSHIEVTKRYSQGKILEINGGAACFSGFESFLSQVVGWGFKTEPNQYKAEIEAIENFYKSLGHNRVDIELCPFVGNHLINFLSQRGYYITELNNVSVLDLKSYHLVAHSKDDGFIIREVKQSELEEWAKRVAIGFGFLEAQEQFYQYASAKGVLAFAAYDHGNLVAGATIAIHGDACDLGVTSTLPLYRGKGLQKKLLFARLNLAKQYGLEFATVTTQPGTVSDLNVQKAGFRCAYTRIKLTME
ncbi:TPA: GNAT family N-acetyltransferase [Legionella pneumophila]|nr:GNAT family N-acetyltransferase [Legionella pneumophila]HAT8640338.1 GNAT family N-acetyltransferase [Legionella pneumophila]HAT8857474.1 GNAT family N-acetyltransferase [Legionella pneumophila subsp. pneumophila]HAT8867018.1 GNAT family N-acetyltransferase [Legionella pneumophila subsp. pneumophila]HAU0161935.1 GNAT family N-acetyltransferase [Legionella pneumophila]